MAPHPLLLTALALTPTAAFLLTAYLRKHPLPLSYTSNIKSSDGFMPSLTKSTSLKTVNPRKHVIMTDTRFLILSSKEVGKRNDEEILATFTHGFFNGMIFTPEKILLSFLGLFRRKLVAVGFTDVPMDGPELTTPSDLARTKLPEQRTVLFHGNFLVLDVQVKETDQDDGSHIDIGFGDSRKRFSGTHRFEMTRVGEERDVKIEYSTIACNPTENKNVFPR